MPLEITFTLSDEDLERFQSIVDKTKTAVAESANDASIEAAARQLIADAKSSEMPGFISDRLAKLELIIDMVGDAEWQLNEVERKRVLGALVYFCDPEDIIPDHIPGIGFLDDAIYVEIIIRELKAEIDSYEDFCKFREVEEARRKERGEDPYVEREAWLADKRATLHARMRKHSGLPEKNGWRLRW